MAKHEHTESDHHSNSNSQSGHCPRCGREYVLVDGLLTDHKVKRTPWARHGRQCRGVHQQPVR